MHPPTHSSGPSAHQRHGAPGFTAIELMVTIAILAVLAALAAPSFTGIMERWRVRQTVEGLQSTFYLARSEAIKRGGGVTMKATSNDWGKGWEVMADGHTLQQIPAPTKVSITLSPSQNAVAVDRWGMMVDANTPPTPQKLDVLVTPAGKGASDPSATRLCVSQAGRIQRASEPANTCF